MKKIMMYTEDEIRKIQKILETAKEILDGDDTKFRIPAAHGAINCAIRELDNEEGFRYES